jgi:hypothetical protein
MYAKQGDQIVIETQTLDALRRYGEVLEVIGQGEREHYRIRWQDGHESVYFPGPGRPSGVDGRSGPCGHQQRSDPASAPRSIAALVDAYVEGPPMTTNYRP